MNKIKFDLRQGDAVKINATKSFMRGVEQNVAGGILEHKATEELIQMDNVMEVSDGGRIMNEVEGGKLNQIGNTMKAVNDGVILNKVSKKTKTALLVILIGITTGIVGFWSDIISLVDHFLRKS